MNRFPMSVHHKQWSSGNENTSMDGTYDDIHTGDAIMNYQFSVHNF
jgi:hypothetical protein